MRTISKSLLYVSLLTLTFSFSLFAQTANSTQQNADEPAQQNQAEATKPDNTKLPDNNKPKDPLENWKFRNLGPAAGGGRITSVVGIPGKPNAYYVGAAAGGVFMTQDGGLTWKPIFEKEAAASIGAIAIAPSNPSVIWVGTGEANIRNDVVTGKGIYLSTDAGSSWRFMGLRDVGQISSIVINPQNPDIVLVGAVGHPWGANPDRGVFRTTDGGKTWQKVLYINDTTGASSLIMDPGNPMVLFAGMWPLERHSWMLQSGGKTGGIFRSTDGGTTWKKLTDGLPEGPTGRIGLAAAPSNPRHVYALVEAKGGVLWDSTDFGDHWKMVSNQRMLNARPFYFSALAVSPRDENKVYFLSYGLVLSEDGGKTARTLGQRVHPDHHAMWIDPDNPDRMIDGNDGGVYISSDAGRTWRYLDNLPIEQFYMVAHDDESPYNLCGGLQDNNGWCGPSNSLSRGGIAGYEWYTVVGGDGEYVVPASGKSHIVYADSQNGSIERLDNQNGLSASVRPYLHGVQLMKPADLKYRFNWTSPIAVSASDPKEVYLGGNVLFKSTDGGAHWNPISPDLTRNDKSKQLSSGGEIDLDLSGAETYNTILSISISPVDPKIIWAGTDDGLVQVTRDGGQHWANVTASVPGLPKDQWGRIQQIESSPHDPGTAFVAIDFHQADNNKPYAFKTHDFGKSWTAINQGLPQDDPARVIREDPNKKGFLVVGTDSGVYYSHDEGAHWTEFKSNFPTVPVYDIKFVKKTHDLVVATHGRGLFVLDNITPLEEPAAQVATNDFHLFGTQPATYWHTWNKHGFSMGSFTAPNPPSGAMIDYWLPTEIKVSPEMKKRERTPVKITVTDNSGQVVRTLYGPSNYGFNRMAWNLRYDAPKKLNFLPPPPAEREEEEFSFDRVEGPAVLPGTYKVAVTVNGKTQTQTVQVEHDPRFNLDASALQAQLKTALELRDSLSALNETLNRISSLHKQITNLQDLLATNEDQGGQLQNASYRPVLEEARALDKKLTSFQEPLYNTELQQGGSDRIHFLQRFQDRLQAALRGVVSAYGQAPTEIQMEEISLLRKELDDHLQKFNGFLNTEVAAFNKKAIEHGSSTLFAGAPVQVRAEGAASAGGNEDQQEPDEQ
jgi:photosystem II stability/assembly factor-like uncharacterized protein